MDKISITHMNNRHNEWLRALDFYKEEIRILKERLTEVAAKNSTKDVLKTVEHFENQFKIQLENIDRLKQNIHRNITTAGKEAAASGAGYVDGVLISEHNNLEQAFTSEENTVNTMRKEFNRFAATWM